ncbi:MAG: DUF45 domain-containing protein [Dehalococcoidia bacterium]|nr:DUF45 domain-containing protein [Dehalococcoidia bacterium]
MSSLPAYTLRVSARARQVRIEVSARHGLVVVVPKGFARSRIPAVLQARQDWIERALGRLGQSAAVIAPPLELPRQIALRAIGEDWVVRTKDAEGPWVRASEAGAGLLLVSGHISHIPACLQVLRFWLQRKSHQRLVPWLRQTSLDEGLPFERTLVKRQRTRWASCSGRHTISINQNLLFLPRRLVRYVFIHELCHTIHLNHSREFWAVLRDKEPAYETLRAELRKASQWVPAWIDPAG